MFRLPSAGDRWRSDMPTLSRRANRYSSPAARCVGSLIRMHYPNSPSYLGASGLSRISTRGALAYDGSEPALVCMSTVMYVVPRGCAESFAAL